MLTQVALGREFVKIPKSLIKIEVTSGRFLVEGVYKEDRIIVKSVRPAVISTRASGVA